MDDEEKKQSNGLEEVVEDPLKKGAEKNDKNLAKKIIKFITWIIISLIKYFLIPIMIAFIMAILATAIAKFLDLIKGEEGKDADAFAVHYTAGAGTGGSSSGSGGEDSAQENIPNQIIVDFNNTTENGAYKLIYKFTDENGRIYNGEEEALLNAIRRDIQEGNPEINVSQFTDAELRVIGTFMYNGVEITRYNEEQLKALVIFVKAGIASQSFDLRPEKELGQAVDMEALQTNDEVYGTIQIQKTKIEEDSDGKLKYNEIKLEYIPYQKFHEMDIKDNVELLNKFSINEEGNLVVARKIETETTYEYLDEKEEKLSEEDKEKILEEYKKENIPLTITVSEEELEKAQFNTKISNYTMNYGVLSDLLIVTQNVDFCLELAELAFNSKIVINVQEQKAETETIYKTNYTQTNLLYDYIDCETYDKLASYENDPREDEIWKTDYEFPNELLTNSLPIMWTVQEVETEITNYYLKYDEEDKKWILYYKICPVDKEIENSSPVLIENKYDENLDEKYTGEEEFKYIIVETFNYKSNINYFEIVEVDTWYAKYKKQYQDKTIERKTTPNSYEGEPSKPQYTEEAKVILDTRDQKEINSDKHVTLYINKMNSQTSNTDINYIASHLTVKQKVKTVKQTSYNSKSTIYGFENNDVDTTHVQLKNIEYTNKSKTFTSKDSVGFLSIYDKYIKSGVDLFLQDDAEIHLFELLESDETDVITWSASQKIKFLLFIYDGVDRGVTEITVPLYDINTRRKVHGTSTANFIKAWESHSLWAYETGKTTAFPTRKMSLDGMNYIVYEDGSAGHNNIAYGFATFITNEERGNVVHPLYGKGYYNSSWKNEFAAVGINVENLYEGALVDKQLADAVFEKVLPKYIAIVDRCLKDELPEYKFSQAQKDALSSIAYQYGNLSGFADAYRESLNEDGTLDAEKLAKNYSRFTSVKETNNRRYANWLLFTQEIYIDRAGDVIYVWNGDTYTNDTHIFPVYNQGDEMWAGCYYGGPNGLPHVNGNKGEQKTIESSGCGCCAMASILSGYCNQLITPDILTQKLDELYPSGDYYLPGERKCVWIFVFK